MTETTRRTGDEPYAPLRQMGPDDSDMATVQATPLTVRDLAECDFYHSFDVPGHGPVRGHWDLRSNLGAYLGGVSFRG